MSLPLYFYSKIQKPRPGPLYLRSFIYVRERPRPNDVRGLSPLPRAENEVPPKMFMFVYILRVL